MLDVCPSANTPTSNRACHAPPHTQTNFFGLQPNPNPPHYSRRARLLTDQSVKQPNAALAGAFHAMTRSLPPPGCNYATHMFSSTDPLFSLYLVSGSPRRPALPCPVFSLHFTGPLFPPHPHPYPYPCPQPKILVESLFDAFGAARRGAVSLEEFVCAVAVMHRGTAPEQLRMLFEVCVCMQREQARRLFKKVFWRGVCFGGGACVPSCLRRCCVLTQSPGGYRVDKITWSAVVSATIRCFGDESLFRRRVSLLMRFTLTAVR